MAPRKPKTPGFFDVVFSTDESPTFSAVHDEDGINFTAGDWMINERGRWVLRIYVPSVTVSEAYRKNKRKP